MLWGPVNAITFVKDVDIYFLVVNLNVSDKHLDVCEQGIISKTKQIMRLLNLINISEVCLVVF